MALYDDELNKRREERREEQRFLAKQQKLLRIGILITALTMIGCVAAIMITKGMISLPDPTQSGSQHHRAHDSAAYDGTAAYRAGHGDPFCGRWRHQCYG